MVAESVKIATKHRLAAIMFSDIVGYAALMGKDEKLALRVLDQSRKLHQHCFTKYGGILLKEMGDGILAQFPSAIDSVQCALEIQKRCRDEMDGQLRIGIHIGDVYIEEKDIFGDGVNIASRLQTMADPGQILISESLYLNVRNQKSIESELLGSKLLKNVEGVMNVYSVTDKTGHKKKEVSSQLKKFLSRRRWIPIGMILIILLLVLNIIDFRVSRPISDRSIAVLPFEIIGNEDETEYFAAGVRDVLINHLNQIDQLSVRSRTSTDNAFKKSRSLKRLAANLNVKYIIEGSTQKFGPDVRIVIQLIDAETDDHLWQKNYDRQFEDIFNVQSEIAQSISKELDVVITEEDVETLNKSPTRNQDAWDAYLRGKYIRDTWSVNDARASIPYFEKAISLDSNFVEPYLEMGWVYLTEGGWFGSKDPKVAYSDALPYVTKAMQINPMNPGGIQLLAALKFYFEWDFAFADSIARLFNIEGSHLNLMLKRNKRIITRLEPIRSEPFSSEGFHWILAYAYLFTEELEKSREVMDEGFRYFPSSEAYFDHFGNVYLHMREFDKSIEVLEEGLKISDKRHPSMVIHLAIAYHEKGEVDKSEEYLQEIIERANSGEFNINVFLAHYYAYLNQREEAFYWLERAYERREVDLIWLSAEPNLNQISRDPRYIDLMKRVGFPENVIPEPAL